MEEFRRFIVDDAKREWNFEQASQIMRIDPCWFVDERSIELIEMWLFYRQNPSQAFPGPLGEQPAIWVSSKIILDSILETRVF